MKGLSQEKIKDIPATVSDLDVIAHYRPDTWAEYRALAILIVSNWDNTYGRARLSGNTLTLITGGWSENEEVMSAVKRNKIFNIVCWDSSYRGGKVIYKLPTQKTFKKK